MKPPPPDALEAWVDRALRELPDQPAPAALNSRVVAELARRAALPWWRRSLSSWPFAARLTLIGILIGLGLLTSPVLEVVAVATRQLDLLQVLANALRHAGSALWQQVPAAWLSVLAMALGLGAFASLGLSLVARRLILSAR